MKILLLAILINATSGAPVALHQAGAFDDFTACGDAAQALGVVAVHDNIATEYICRKVEEDGAPVPGVKVGPDDSPFAEWLQKQMERQENRS
jgi:hypothetical protein